MSDFVSRAEFESAAALAAKNEELLLQCVGTLMDITRALEQVRAQHSALSNQVDEMGKNLALGLDHIAKLYESDADIVRRISARGQY